MRVRITHDRGAVLVQIVIALAVLFGFTALTTDYGMMAVRQRKLQSATDAAALAAGPEMFAAFNAGAEGKARDYAAANTAESDNVELKWTSPYSLEVTAWSEVETPFLRVLDGRPEGRRVSAVSEVAAVTPMSLEVTSKLRPWGIPIAFFNPGNDGLSKIHFNEDVQLVLVENVNEQPEDTPDGVYFIQPFALEKSRRDDASGDFPNYTHDVKFGYGKPISASDTFDQNTWMTSQPGKWDDILNATYRAVMSDSDSLVNRSDRDEAYRNDTPDNYNPDNPRLIFLPIYDRVNMGQGVGDPKGQIYGFTAFYLEDMSGNTINGRFVRHALPYNGHTLEPVSVEQIYTGIIQFHLVK